MEIERLNLEYEKSKSFENPVSRIQILEEFKALTDSSSMPESIKDRFNKVADLDIKKQVAILEVVKWELWVK